MASLETSSMLPPQMNSAESSTATDNAWVVEILAEDNLRLADAKQLKPYGRAKLGVATRIVMWAMRIYVLLSFILIIAQIYISLRPN